MKPVSTYILLLLVTVNLSSQEYIKSAASVTQRQLSIQQRGPDEEKLYAEQFARLYGIPVKKVKPDGTVMEIVRISSDGLPLYLKTHNFNAARTTSTDQLWLGGGLGLELHGKGIVVGVWDGGTIRSSHNEFEGRVRLIDDSSDPIFHATHVAGTIAAAGKRTDARGMASEALVDGYNWDSDDIEMNNAAKQGMLISNHSYGYIQGWDYNDESDRWEWYGNVNISTSEDYNFGFYGSDAQDWDEIAYDNPWYMIVKSAGNDRGEGPLPGAKHFVWTAGGWTESNEIRERDGNGSYDCIETQATAKNILTVGAANDIPTGYSEPSDVLLATFSVFGPTDDGRIKPDIIGNGIGLTSTNSTRDDSYTISSGTSMSSPNIAGSLALLQQHYHNINGAYMQASLLKALVLHTADDAGNPGPDYQSGWGIMNSASAANLISIDKGDNLVTDTIGNNQSAEYVFYSTGREKIRITIAWTDPAGDAPPAQLNPSTPMLVNDLDVRLHRVIDNFEFKPFILDPLNPAQNAVAGDNRVDNVEQILVNTPVAGYYRVIVSHKGSLSGGSQIFSMAASGVTREYFADGLITRTDANGDIILTSAKEYLNNMSVQWLINPANGLPVSFYFDSFRTEADKDVLRIYDGSSPFDPLIAEFSGKLSNPDTTITTEGSMLLVFISDVNTVDSGFAAKYCTVPPKDIFSVEGMVYPCANSVEPYFVVGQEGVEYLWKPEFDWEFIENTDKGIDLEIGSAISTLSVTPYNRCGEGNDYLKEIIPLNTTPQLSAIIGDTIPCIGSEYLYATEEIPGTSYEWTLPETWRGSSNSSSISVRPAIFSGEISVIATNGCGVGDELKKLIKPMDRPSTVNIFTERISPCAESVQSFYITNLSGHSYSWSLNADWEIVSGQTNDTVVVRVGDMSNYMVVDITNKCGSRESDKLFNTSPLPEKPVIMESQNDFGYPLLTVTNRDAFESLQWYMNGVPVQGDAGTRNPLVATRNGFYTVASVSDRNCYNTIADELGVEVENSKFTFVAYRLNENTIAIENTLTVQMSVNIISIYGRTVYIGDIQPGFNEIYFPDSGVHLIHIFGNGERYILKTAL